MGKVMMLAGGEYIYWNSVLIAAGALAAALMAVALRLWKGERLLPMLLALPIAGLLGLYAARLLHWYCRYESYESLAAALGDLRGGGWSLMGAFAGGLLAFALLRLLRLTDNLPALLDRAAPAAALGVAVGRLGDLFTTADRGKMLFASEALHRLPYASAVANTASGALEWRFAVFCAQSIWAAVIFFILLLRTLLPRRALARRPEWADGGVFFLFLQLYCSGQIVTDSARYDALFLRSNGFVSLEQIVCAVCLAAVLAIYSVRSVRAHGWRWYHPVCWAVALLGLGLTGFMEYYVQRHGDEYVFAYGMMIEGLLIFFCATCAMLRSTQKRADP